MISVRKVSLPLSPAARVILERQPHRQRDLIFGIGNGGYSGWSDAKAALDQRLLAGRKAKAKAMPNWRIHDIRRTAATMMGDRLGIFPHIVEAILNHVSGHKGGVAGVYNRARYEGEMRVALQRWSDYVTALTT